MIGPLGWTIVGPLLLAGAAALPPLRHGARWLCAFGAAATLGTALAALADFAIRPGADIRLREVHAWSRSLGADFALGVDGVGAAMLLLSGLITLVATIAAPRDLRRPHAYHALVLVLLAATNTVFCATDLLVFYVAWEAVLVPMLLLIGLWGGEQRRYAATKFFVFTMAGSVPMLGLLIALWTLTPAGAPPSFDLGHLAGLWQTWRDTEVCGVPLAPYGFAALLLACLVKLPAVPLHTWLPHAHVQAPTPVSVLLAGVLLKLGVYGLFRVGWPLFPTVATAWAPALGGIALAGILWGALSALGQNDLKRLVAYSSISHMGFCLFGLASGTAAGALGALVQAFAHGLSSPLLFLLVGVVYDRAHHRDVDGFGGLAAPMPRFSWLLLLAALAGAGLPGLGGFVGEFLVFTGGFTGRAPFPALAALATLAIVLSAAYLLWTVQRVAYGPLRDPAHAAFPDCTRQELAAMLPLAVLLVLIGLWPAPLAAALRDSCDSWLAHVQGALR